jgi:hypothetical protein
VGRTGAGYKFIAVAAALLAAGPAFAVDPLMGFNPQGTVTTMFFVSIPLDGKSKKERDPAYGLAFQGKAQGFVVDTKLLSNFGIETLAGLEIKWVLAGAAAVAAAAAVGGTSSTRTQQTQQLAATTTGSTSTTGSTGTTATTTSTTTLSTGGTTTTSGGGGTTTTTTTGGSTTVDPCACK